jgi:hypothetical protein
MALTIIRGATATGFVKLTPTLSDGTAGSLQDWTHVFQSVRIRSTLPQIDATVYGNQANGAFIAGIERLTFDMSGLLTYDDAESPALMNVGPTFPLASYQNCTILRQFDTGCTVSAAANFTDGEINQPAGAMGVITAQAVSTGAFTVTWPRAAIS